jgi:pimeloyl-ACP methyl ester carboxylesterase
MNATTDQPRRIFTGARITALAVIAVLVVGLAYLRFGPGDDTVSVWSGAKAGDVRMHACTYDTEQGGVPADCGTLVVPENRADRRSRLIALPVTRVRSRAAHPKEPIFRLEGGPGLSNMTFPQASRYRDDRDVVLIGYRGVDGSSRLDCPEVTSVLKRSPDFLAASSERARVDAFAACADRLQGDGVDLAGYTLAQRVDDFDAARRALGYDRIDLVSESAGTRAAMIYAWRHPASIHRSVMIGVNPPGHFLWDGPTTDAQLEHYSQLCADDSSCRSRVRDLAASMRETSADMPGDWMFLPVEANNVRLASFFGLVNSAPDASPISGPMTLDSWIRAADGDASGFWLQSVLSRIVFPETQVWGDAASIAREDFDAARQAFSSNGRDRSILRNTGARFLWADGKLVGAWPDAPDSHLYQQVRPSSVETLLIGGTLDFATPAVNATAELLPSLPNGHQVVLSEFGHSGDFWGTQKAAGTHLVASFLDHGTVDDSRYHHQAIDFTPSSSQSSIAKIVIAVVLGIGVAMVLVLATLAIRIRRRGGTGRKTGAWIRSIGPILFGLGGWFLGLLLVLTLWPTVALDNQLLAVLSTAVPIGLGVYAGWVRSDTSSRMRAKGIRNVAVGALVGAWIGFHATSGLAALLTTIVGAAVAANLGLLVLDIWSERAARSRATAPVDGEPPAAPETRVVDRFEPATR